MKGLSSAVAAFLIGSLGAGYIALAPFGSTVAGASGGGVMGAIDAPAMALIQAAGRSNAVLALLVAGTVLALVLLTIGHFRDKADVDSEPADVAAEDIASPPSPPLHAPRSADDRLQALRQRANSEGSAVTPFDVTSADTAQSVQGALTPRPVMLVRKARERDRDWFNDTSWLGGLPRLGDAVWPRDTHGQPLPFAAQIDLAQISAACPESPLPASGSLAFFLGSGAVVHVPDGPHDFTAPPDGLPPAFDEGGYPLPQHRTRLSREFFRFWPVDLIGLDMPEALRSLGDEERHVEITDTMYALLDQQVPESGDPDHLQHIEGSDYLWWFAAQHLAQRLHSALERADARLADARSALQAAAETVAAREADFDADPALADSARASHAQAQARLDDIAAQHASLPQMVSAMDGFCESRDPWQRMTADEAQIIADILNECRAAYPDLVRHHLPHSASDLHTLCVREMMTGDNAALSALPDALLDHRNRHYRLTGAIQHQMFGLGGCQQHALYDHLDDLLLLQLAYDADMDWLFGDMGLFQFWITPEHAAAGRWDKAVMTFEMG